MAYARRNAHYWALVTAVTGIAATGGVGAQHVSDGGGGQPSPTQSQAEPAAKPNPPPTTTIQDAIERVARALEAANDKPDAAEEKERNKRDLAAQEEMAFWAKWMFWATLGGAVLGAVSLFLIWRTVLYTRRAADEGKRSADEARRSADAAEQGLAIARDSAEATAASAHAALQATEIMTRRETPYVYLKSINSVAKNVIGVTFENTGKSSAIATHVFVAARRMKGPPSLDDVELVSTTPVILRPEVPEELAQIRTPAPTLADVREAELQNESFWVYGIVRHTGILDDVYEVGFSKRYSVNEGRYIDTPENLNYRRKLSVSSTSQPATTPAAPGRPEQSPDAGSRSEQ